MSASSLALIPTPTTCDPIDEDMGIIIRRQVPNVVCLGDSLTYGIGATTPGGAGSYPYQLATALGLPYGVRVRNKGIPSQGVPDIPDVTYLIDDYNLNHALLFWGFNNIYAAHQSAASTWAAYQPIIAAFVAAGLNVVLFTLTGTVAPGTAAYRSEAQAFDALIRASGYPYVDLAADPNIGTLTSGSVTYYDGDGTHLKDAGYAIIVSKIQALGLNGTTRATRAVSAGIADFTGVTGYYRDMFAVSPATATPDVSPIYSISAGDLTTKTFTSSGAFPQRELNSINGKPTINYNGVDQFSVGPILNTMITSTAGLMGGVAEVTGISSNDTTNYNLNNALIGDASNNFEIYFRGTAGSYFIGIWAWNGGAPQIAEAPISLNVPFSWDAKIDSSRVHIRTGNNSFTPSVGTITSVDVSGQMRIARNGGTSYGAFKLAELVTRQDNGASVLAGYYASRVARYGL